MRFQDGKKKRKAPTNDHRMKEERSIHVSVYSGNLQSLELKRTDFIPIMVTYLDVFTHVEIGLGSTTQIGVVLSIATSSTTAQTSNADDGATKK